MRDATTQDVLCEAHSTTSSALTRIPLTRFRVLQPAHDQEACSLLQPLDVGTRWLRFDSWAEQQFRGV